MDKHRIGTGTEAETKKRKKPLKRYRRDMVTEETWVEREKNAGKKGLVQ